MVIEEKDKSKKICPFFTEAWLNNKELVAFFGPIRFEMSCRKEKQFQKHIASFFIECCEEKCMAYDKNITPKCRKLCN